jgi:Kef-type K+ transport system membrane component KefB
MENLFGGLAVVVGLAAVGGMVARMFRQPAILGYVAAGILISATRIINVAQMRPVVDTMGQLGVTLLLFLAGLELPIAELKKMGKVALTTGIGQIVITSIVGFAISKLMGFGNVTALYLGIGLTFGSTILVVKLLSEKGDLQSLYGKIAVGYLLVQDFVAIGLLVVLTGMSRGEMNVGGLVWIVIKAVVMVAVAVWLSGVMGKVMDYLGNSTELLFIGSLAWCLVVAAIVSSPAVGFSVEIGGFLAGLTLANAMEQAQIISRVRPLRDFFLTWFFVILGANIQFGTLGRMIFPGIIFSVYVLVGNPLIVMAILGWLGFKRRTIFMASLAVAQVSEFSLIVMTSAVRNGQVGQEILALLTLVALTTMTFSTYLIWNADKLYRKFGKLARFWEKKKTLDVPQEAEKLDNHIVLFGHNRIGSELRPVLEKMGKKVLVVDFNPAVVDELSGEGTPAVYGDMSDLELYEKLGIEAAEAVVSTVPDLNDNLTFLAEVSKYKKRPMAILTAADKFDAARLYESGADYVLIPHSVGGQYLAQIFEHHGLDKEYWGKIAAKL